MGRVRYRELLAVRRGRTSMPSSVVLFGSTGYVGTLILAELLHSTTWRIVLPVRPVHDVSGLLQKIEHSCQQLSGRVDPDWRHRLSIFALPPPGKPITAPFPLRRCHIERVINAAGNVNYFAKAELNEGNVELTRRTLEFARRIGSPNYVYVSTAFSAGYRQSMIGEVLHDEPEADPTYYTKTKRMAENMVAESGLPYLIVRPSVLIGDSRTGFYSGKAYGLYQFLKSFTYFLTDRYYPDVHVVAPEYPFHLLHQDTFASLFMSLLTRLEAGRIVNMVSPEANLPTTRDLYRYFFAHVTHPKKVFLYDDLENVPLDQIPRRQRMFLQVTRVNAQIIGRCWSFGRGTLANLENGSAHVAATTVASTERCMNVYVRESAKCQSYMRRYRSQFSSDTTFVAI